MVDGQLIGCLIESVSQVHVMESQSPTRLLITETSCVGRTVCISLDSSQMAGDSQGHSEGMAMTTSYMSLSSCVMKSVRG